MDHIVWPIVFLILALVLSSSWCQKMVTFTFFQSFGQTRPTIATPTPPTPLQPPTPTPLPVPVHFPQPQISHPVPSLHPGFSIRTELGRRNVLAIACGASDGFGFGANARAALITRGLAEMTRLVVKKGGKARQFWGVETRKPPRKPQGVLCLVGFKGKPGGNHQENCKDI